MTDITKADHDAALAVATSAGTKAGASAERARVSAILDHAEAKGRETLARHLAFASDMAPEAAAEILKASPKAEAPGRTPRLDGNVPAPSIEPDAGGEGSEGGEMDEYQKGAAAAKAALGIR